jgi:vitamin B12 transport system permease protein
MVLADIVARLALDSAELPLGVVTTTIGAPIFIWMLVRNHDSR